MNRRWVHEWCQQMDKLQKLQNLLYWGVCRFGWKAFPSYYKYIHLCAIFVLEKGGVLLLGHIRYPCIRRVVCVVSCSGINISTSTRIYTVRYNLTCMCGNFWGNCYWKQKFVWPKPKVHAENQPIPSKVHVENLQKQLIQVQTPDWYEGLKQNQFTCNEKSR